MYAKILIPTIAVLAAIGACQPIPPNSNIVPGVFITSDTLKSLEEKARQNEQKANTQTPALQSNSAPIEQRNPQQLASANHNEPQNMPMPANPANAQNYQAQPANNQQPLYTNQPQQAYASNPQQVIAQPQQTYASNPQLVAAQPQQIYANNPQQVIAQPQMMAANSQSQPGQQTILISQPMLSNQQPMNQQPLILSQQPNQQFVLAQPTGANQPQILVAQPNQQQQGILMNPQNSQSILVATNQLPNNVMIQNPNGMGQAALIGTPSNAATMGKSLPNQSIYAVVPLNNQNLPNNMNSGNTYLVPIQQMPSNSLIVSAGK